jgi:hypothetical protein
MKTLEITRKLFQTFASILIIIQLHQNIKKYFHHPVVVETSKVLVKDLTPPVVYVCQTNQFNPLRAGSQGYDFITDFATGTMKNSNTVTWQGKYGNLTYQALEDLAFDYDYKLPDPRNNALEKKFFLSKGICMKLTNITQKPHMLFETEKEVIFFMVDPAKENDIYPKQTEDATSRIGPTSRIGSKSKIGSTSASFYDRKVYEIEYKLHDSRVHDGVTCTDYDNSEWISYRNCLNVVKKKRLLSTYGCLPPWFPHQESDKLCETVKDKTKEEIKKDIRKDLIEILNNREIDSLNECLLPCITTEIKFKETRSETNRLKMAILSATNKKWATVDTEFFSYTIFSLTVDIGSALGWWLGLSCLSILDVILINLYSVKKYWKQ